MIKIEDNIDFSKPLLHEQLERLNYLGCFKSKEQLIKMLLEAEERIDKAIKYMNNTFCILSVKDIFYVMNKMEEILKGEDK